MEDFTGTQKHIELKRAAMAQEKLELATRAQEELYPNGTNTPVFDEKDVFMRPNYMVIKFEALVQPLFYKDLDEVREGLNNIVRNAMPEDPEVYLIDNVVIYDLNTTNRVYFKTKVNVEVDFQ